MVLLVCTSQFVLLSILFLKHSLLSANYRDRFQAYETLTALDQTNPRGDFPTRGRGLRRLGALHFQAALRWVKSG